jgi:predicted nucleic acid-binding protein
VKITVVDASVAIKWFFPDVEQEEHVTDAVDVLMGIGQGNIQLVQPPHWMIEVIAVISRLHPKMAADAIDLLDAMEISIAADTEIYKRASRLSSEINYHLFDTLYHALALEYGGTLITADKRYYNKTHRLGNICLLADFKVDVV